MSHNSEIFTVRVPEDVKQKLPVVAADHGMTTPEFIRAILRLIADGKISLALVFEQDNHDEQVAS